MVLSLKHEMDLLELHSPILQFTIPPILPSRVNIIAIQIIPGMDLLAHSMEYVPHSEVIEIINQQHLLPMDVPSMDEHMQTQVMM